MVTHDFEITVFVNTDSFVCSLINEYQWITVPYKYMFDHWYTTCDIFWCSVIYSDVQSWHIHHKAAKKNNLSTNGVIFFPVDSHSKRQKRKTPQFQAISLYWWWGAFWWNIPWWSKFYGYVEMNCLTVNDW